MLDAIQAGFNKARNLFGGLFAAIGAKTPTRNEMRLPAEEWAVKKKLGRAFFAKRLNPNYRAAKIASLTCAEWHIACDRGWL